TGASTEATTEATVAAPGDLRVSTSTLDLGSGTSGSVQLSNVGGTAVTYTVKPRVSWLSVSRTKGSLGADAKAGLRITADTATLGEGSSTGNVAVTWSGGTIVVAVRVTVDRAPTIGSIQVGGPTDCTGRTVSTTVSDANLASVTVSWSGNSGTGQKAMTATGGGWSADIGPFPIGGTVTATVTATDKGGHTTTRSTSFATDPCPG
ncbi:MAG TPA: hypothetical protein VGE43_08670, partial [Acidimicrobiales bacterium]